MSTRSTRGILAITLALALVFANVAFSGHAASHMASSSDFCTMCAQAAGTNCAIAPDAYEFPIPRPAAIHQAVGVENDVPSEIYHDSLSRAPPAIN